MRPGSLQTGSWSRLSGRCRKARQIVLAARPTDARITVETDWHTHHIVWRVNGGSDRLTNLALLHPNLHRQVHSHGHPLPHRVLSSAFKHDLPLVPQRLPKAIAQLTQRALSSYQSALRRLSRNSKVPDAFAYGSDEPVPPPVQSLNKSRILRAVLERTSDIEDELFYGLRLDMCNGPHRIEQLIMRHQPSGVLHQIAQDRKRLGRQQDALIASLIPVAPQTLVWQCQAGMAGTPSMSQV